MSKDYGWFSPVKGTYPGLAQIDKTARVALNDVENVVRGTVLVLGSDEAGATFAIANASSDPALCFFALQDGKDTQAELAGSVWYDSDKYPKTAAEDPLISKKVRPAKKGPAITGIAVNNPGEYETSEIKADDDFAIGATVYLGADGLLAASGSKAIGVVTEAKHSRWCNDAPAGGNGNRQGAKVDVIRFKVA